MANLNKETRAVLGTAADKIGHYGESTGGGDPLQKGEHFEVADTPEEAEKMREQNPGTKVRVNQPRNADGTFGYNSQNARKLKYGPSRGTTVPDFLRGVDLLFLEEGTSMVMEGENGIEYYLSTINMTKEQLIENCKHYIEDTQGFAGIHEGIMTKKMGRHSKDEKERAQQLQDYRKDADSLRKNKMSVQDFMNKYQNGKPSGIVSSDSKPKLSSNTLQKIADEQINYDKIEKALSGLDAADLGGNTWGVTNYNKAGVTQQGVQERDDWRKKISSQPPVPSVPSVPPSGGAGGGAGNGPSGGGSGSVAPSTAPGGGTPLQKQPVTAGVGAKPVQQQGNKTFNSQQQQQLNDFVKNNKQQIAALKQKYPNLSTAQIVKGILIKSQGNQKVPVNS